MTDTNATLVGFVSKTNATLVGFDANVFATILTFDLVLCTDDGRRVHVEGVPAVEHVERMCLGDRFRVVIEREEG